MSSTTTGPAGNPKKTENKLTRDMGSEEFASTSLDLYDGPKVTVIIQPRNFSLPKRLLSHSSAFFDIAFNGEFKESQEQEVDLTDLTSVGAFEFAIKWMYTGILVIPERSVTTQQKLSQLIDFFKLADFLQLSGPFTGPLETVKSMLVDARANSDGKDLLEGYHIRSAMALPARNPLRNLIANACVLPYIESVRVPKSKFSPRASFKYLKEFNEIDTFAVDLFRSFDVALRTRSTSSLNIKDPLTGISVEGI